MAVAATEGIPLQRQVSALLVSHDIGVEPIVVRGAAPLHLLHTSIGIVGIAPEVLPCRWEEVGLRLEPCDALTPSPLIIERLCLVSSLVSSSKGGEGVAVLSVMECHLIGVAEPQLLPGDRPLVGSSGHTERIRSVSIHHDH